jgi:hypothetical protein
LLAKNLSCEAKQSIPHAADILQRLPENVQRLCPELWCQNNLLLHQDNTPSDTSFFTRESLTKNNMSVVPYPPSSCDLVPCNFSLFLRLKIKLKGHHFDTIEVIESESQVVLNTFTEHDLQDAFKQMAEMLETVDKHGRGLHRG